MGVRSSPPYALGRKMRKNPAWANSLARSSGSRRDASMRSASAKIRRRNLRATSRSELSISAWCMDPFRHVSIRSQTARKGFFLLYPPRPRSPPLESQHLLRRAVCQRCFARPKSKRGLSPHWNLWGMVRALSFAAAFISRCSRPNWKHHLSLDHHCGKLSVRAVY
jgi:hypothetical protein